MDVSDTIQPKSDQLNADDLIPGMLLVRIERVRRGNADQPIQVEIGGKYWRTDDPPRQLRPWKPCKSMRRVLVSMWGKDARAWAGKHLLLYRDPQVKWAGKPVGGIRIKAAEIPGPLDVQLTVTRGRREPARIEVLQPDHIARQWPQQAAGGEE